MPTSQQDFSNWFTQWVRWLTFAPHQMEENNIGMCERFCQELTSGIQGLGYKASNAYTQACYGRNQVERMRLQQAYETFCCELEQMKNRFLSECQRLDAEGN